MMGWPDVSGPVRESEREKRRVQERTATGNFTQPQDITYMLPLNTPSFEQLQLLYSSFSHMYITSYGT